MLPLVQDWRRIEQPVEDRAVDKSVVCFKDARYLRANLLSGRFPKEFPGRPYGLVVVAEVVAEA